MLLIDRGRILLVRRANAPARDLYAFPGGRVGRGETPAAAALRELHEETGLVGREPQPFRVYDLIEQNDDGAPTSHFELAVFRARLDPASPAEPVAADDALEARWFSPSETRALPMPESVRECIRDIMSAES